MAVQNRSEADKRPPTCPTCLERYQLPDVPGAAHRRPHLLHTRKEVMDLATGTPDKYRHSAKPSGLIAQYIVDKSQALTCSFPDHQRHWHGSVIRMDCGLTLLIGRDCVWSNLHGAHAIAAAMAAVDEHAAHLRSIADLDAQLGRAISSEEMLTKMEFFRGELRRYFPSFVLQLQLRSGALPTPPNRARLTEAFDMRVAKADGKSTLIRQNLVGLALWTKPHPLKDTIWDLQKAGEVRSGIGDLDDPANELDVAYVAKAVEKARNRIDRATDWIAAAHPFFSTQNLDNCIEACELRRDKIEAAYDGFRFRDGNRYVHLGLLGGLQEVTSRASSA